MTRRRAPSRDRPSHPPLAAGLLVGGITLVIVLLAVVATFGWS